jgi:hypothetical protein
MVPKPEKNDIKYISSLKTLFNIFGKLTSIAEQKKKFILTQKWKELHAAAMVQEKLNELLDSSLREVQSFKNLENTGEIKTLKISICSIVNEYRYMENLNARLLKDALFVSKQKAQKFFNLDCQNETYSRNIKNISDLWGNKPLLHDRLA